MDIGRPTAAADCDDPDASVKLVSRELSSGKVEVTPSAGVIMQWVDRIAIEEITGMAEASEKVGASLNGAADDGFRGVLEFRGQLDPCRRDIP